MKDTVAPGLVTVGLVLLVVAAWLLWSGPVALAVAGVECVTVGLFVDLD